MVRFDICDMKFFVVLLVLSPLITAVQAHTDPRGTCLYGRTVDEIPVEPNGKGTIVSVGYPYNYEGNANCQHVMYKTLSNMRTKVIMELIDYRVEPVVDVLQISEAYYPIYNLEAASTAKTFTSELVDGELVLADTNTGRGTYKWVSTFSGNITIKFKSNTEINGPGYKIKYAFGDCLELDTPEHGVYTAVEYEGQTRYRLDCDEGYEIAPTDILDFINSGDLSRSYTPYYYAYCTGRGKEEEHPYTWVHTDYFCAKLAGQCKEPPIKYGSLVQSMDDPLKFDVVCDVEGNTVRGPRSIHCFQSDQWRWREWDSDNQDPYAFPRCIAQECDVIKENKEIKIIHSANDYTPGSYVRERCIYVYKIEDVTRWCLPTGKWTPPQQCDGKEDDQDEEEDGDLYDEEELQIEMADEELEKGEEEKEELLIKKAALEMELEELEKELQKKGELKEEEEEEEDEEEEEVEEEEEEEEE